MVVSTQRDAALAGAEMLEKGGNAVDAAVATAFAVAVTQPFSAGLGGGVFMLVRIPDGQVFAVDARETAPAAATADMYVKEGAPERGSVHGALAIATPAFVQGLELAHAKWGRLKWKDVLKPAIRLAKDGFVIGRYHSRMVGFMQQRLPAERFPETARIQFEPLGPSPAPGMRLVQPDLARTLKRVAKNGAKEFTHGETAKQIAAEVARRGGILTLEDLQRVQPKLREPVRGQYRGLEVFSFPPPSSGGAVLVQALQILEGFDLAAMGAGSSASLHHVAEAMKLAFADRAVYMGDSDFVDVPLERLTSVEYAETQRARIDPDKAGTVVPAPQLPDDAGTTHLSTTDDQGGAVALTMTINTPFGSGITVPGTGVVLNNEMDDFSVAPGTPNSYGLIDERGANSIAPGKRPLSSMTPTIVLKDGAPFMVTGSPGGPRIISTTLLTILNVVDWGMDPQAAVAAPRFHHQWVPDVLSVEPETPVDVVEGLTRRGHDVAVSQRHWSAAETIVIDPASGVQMGGSDPRTDGAAVGVGR
jgi:gamma-glutamyltranspeptidase/glutathione hydrolase